MRRLLLILMMVLGCNVLSGGPALAQIKATIEKVEADTAIAEAWPVLKRYDQDHIEKVALPLGGIGTGTVSLGGRGDLRDWEIMNCSSKRFVPLSGRSIGPFFAFFAGPAGDESRNLPAEIWIQRPSYLGYVFTSSAVAGWILIVWPLRGASITFKVDEESTTRRSIFTWVRVDTAGSSV